MSQPLTVSVLKGLEQLYPQISLIEDLRKSLQVFPEERWDGALSRGQLESKLWLIEELNKLAHQWHEPKIFICGGWYAVLARLIFDRGQFLSPTIRSFDRDESCAAVAETLNRSWVISDWRFKAFTADMLDLNYERIEYETYRANGTSVQLTEVPDIIINTSCEHISEFSKWFASLPKGKCIVLQSTDLEDPEHINKVSSLDEFKEAAPMTYRFAGQLALPEKGNTRFMLIGVK